MVCEFKIIQCIINKAFEIRISHNKHKNLYKLVFIICKSVKGNPKVGLRLWGFAIAKQRHIYANHQSCKKCMAPLNSSLGKSMKFKVAAKR